MNSTKLNQDCSWLCVLFLLLPMVAELAGAAIDKKKTTVLPPPTKKTTKQQTTTKRTTKTVQPQKTQSDQGGTGSHAGPNGYRPRPGDQTKDLQGGGKEYHNPQTGQTVTTNARGEVQRIEAPYGSSQNKIVISRGAHRDEGCGNRPSWRTGGQLRTKSRICRTFLTAAGVHFSHLRHRRTFACDRISSVHLPQRGLLPLCTTCLL